MKQVTKRRLWIESVVLVVLLVFVVARSFSSNGGNHHEFTGFKQEADGLKAVFRVENLRHVEMTANAVVSGYGAGAGPIKLSLRGDAMLNLSFPEDRTVFWFLGANPAEFAKIPIPAELTNVVIRLEISEDRLADPSHPQVWTDAKVWFHSWLEKRGATNLAASLKWKKTTLVSPRR